VNTYGSLKSGESRKDVQIQAGGRIYNKRTSGTKLVFYDIRSEGVKMQIMVRIFALPVHYFAFARAVP